jgi:hypothetical protein
MSVIIGGTVYGAGDVAKRCADPSSPPDLLLSLVDARREVGAVPGASQALARNPGVPLEGLLELVRDHPLEVTQNPAFRLQQAMSGDFVWSLPVGVQCAIARCPDVDEALIRQLASSRRRPVMVRTAAARNPACPPDLVAAYMRQAWRVRNGLAANPALPAALVGRLASDHKKEVRASVGRRSTLSDALLQQLSVDTEPRVRATIARRAGLSPRLLLKMAASEHASAVQCALIRNRNMPDDGVARFSASGRDEVQKAMQQYRPRARGTVSRGVSDPSRTED